MAPLASRLAAGGWTVMRNAAAGLSFHREVAAPRPPGSLDQGTLASQTAVAQPAPDRLTALGEGLRPQGWDLRRDAAGKLLLMPTSLGLFSA